MKNIFPIFFLSFLILVTINTGSAQVQTPAPTPVALPADDEVVKITTKVVQLDLIVVDKDGKQVRGLTAADFELLQDGKPQRISSFSYVNKEQVQSPPKTDPKSAEIPPPVKVTSSNVGRVITFIVDDGNCKVSNIGIRASREGIEKFIREQMQPTDIVAIYQTRSGSSVFQQHTNDKMQLLKIAHKIQWYPPTGTCSTGDGSFYAAAKSNTYIKVGPGGMTTKTVESDDQRKSREHLEDQTNNNQIVGTLGVIRYVVQGLARIPGRKVVFLMSDGLPFRARNGETLSAADVLRDLTEMSNRASVVFNTIDSRGLFDANMIEARDEVYAQDDINATNKIGNDRQRDVLNSQDGLRFFANETGGAFSYGQNFLDVPIKKDLSVETGYYLLAYEPTDETFKSKKFNKIEVKVKRPDLKVISRTGFFGVENEIAKAKKRSENSDLYEAIVSPLPVAGLNVELTAYFANSPEMGNFVRAFFRLDGDEIKFAQAPNGNLKAVIDVVAITLNEKSGVADEFTKTHIIQFVPAAMPTVKQNGLVYSVDVPIKKPGTYNFRVAVRDGTTQMLGSAGQIVQIPDLKKPGIFLSGLTVSEVDQNGKFELPGAASSGNAFSLPMSSAVPAIRRFRRGATLAYAYAIYNAQLDKASGEPKIETTVNLYKDGKMLLAGVPQAAVFQKQTDWSRIGDFAYIKLRPAMELGSYTLQIVAKDTLAGGKNNSSSQWIDFEIVD